MKKFKRILAVIFCCLFVFLVGCDEILEDNGVSVKAFDGVKVLSRPTDYFDNIGEVVGDKASEFYYNIFAANILYGLYSIYENPLNVNEDLRGNYFDFEDLFPTDDYTYRVDGNVGSDGIVETDFYYLFDSLRYTITNVSTTKEGEEIKSQTLTLAKTKWNWTVDTDEVGSIFKNIYDSEFGYITEYTENDSLITVKFGENFFDIYENVIPTIFVNAAFRNFLPSFSNLYYSAEISNGEEGEDRVVEYWTSPFYDHDQDDQQIEGLKNNYQDALEYATYMFVLGFDYQGDAETTAVMPNLFRFEEREGAFYVAGWNADGTINSANATANVTVQEALGFAKELYKVNANIVGVTQEIQDKVERFILDEVIGENAFLPGDTTQNGNFSVTFDDGTPEKHFNRNYRQIVKNVVAYACQQAPIGFDESSGTKVMLGNSYMASQIQDFPYNSFLLHHADNDAHAFQNIPAAEYQSMIFFPKEEDIGKNLGTLILAFEYFDNPNNKTMLDQLDLTVGLRYYDHEERAYTVDVQTEKSILMGDYATVSKENMPDVNWLIIDNSKDQTAVDLPMPKDLKMKTKFENDDPIFAFPSPVKISGTSAARAYYKPNNSDYGTFGSLYGEIAGQEDRAYRCWGLEKDCDYVEVYFLIHKTAGNVNTNYNFKVGVQLFTAAFTG